MPAWIMCPFYFFIAYLSILSLQLLELNALDELKWLCFLFIQLAIVLGEQCPYNTPSREASP